MRQFASIRGNIYMIKTNKIESELVYKITGCAMTVLNELGHGLREKTYERALCVEFDIQEIKYSFQKEHKVIYKGHHIDNYIPDMEVENKLILELKTVDTICDEHIGQVINYLKITGLEVGVILNFKHPKLEWKKVVLTKENRK